MIERRMSPTHSCVKIIIFGEMFTSEHPAVHLKQAVLATWLLDADAWVNELVLCIDEVLRIKLRFK